MASGKDHARVSIITSTIMLPIGWFILSWDISLMISLGILSGVFLTPDLDLNNISWSQRYLIQRSFVLGKFWQYYWLPYSRIVPHRSWWSHSFPVGTILQLVYIAPVGFIIWLCFRLVFQVPPSICSLYLLLLGTGKGVSDILHILVDTLSSFLRRSSHRLRKKS